MNKPENTYPQAISEKLVVFVFILISLSISCLPAYSQSKIQTDTSSYQADSIIKYITPLEYAFMMHENTSWLFKLNTSPTNYDMYSFGISVEKRVIPSFTINLKVQTNAIISQHEIDFSNTQTYSLETRWYYAMKKRIRENKGSANMSGNYLALGIDGYFASGFSFYSSTVYAKWGLQRRFLKSGYIDFGLKGGVGGLSRKDGRTFLILGTFTDIGFAFAKDKYKLDHEKLCPVLKCYDADNFVFKSNLINIFSIALFGSSKSMSISPNIAFEKKLGKSAFSINTEFDLSLIYHYLEYNQKDFNLLRIDMFLSMEGRWYYNLKNRMLKGKTGNSLSANYLAVGGSYSFSETTNFSDPISEVAFPATYFSTGIQRLISKHLYYDFNIGIGYWFDTTNSSGGLIWPFNIAVGYRF